jgi:hypothetical protein
MPKQYLLIILFFTSSIPLFAQSESLLDELNAMEQKDSLSEIEKPKRDFVENTFLGTRVINGQSTEMLSKNILEFNIAHRFGRVNGGWREFFGLDQASMRIGLQFAILGNLSVSIGRSTYLKTFDGFIKYKVLSQSKKNENFKSIPLNITLFTATAIDTRKELYPDDRPYKFNQRVSYTNQILISRKFNKWLSLQIAPTLVHYNIVLTPQDKNTLFLLGSGAMFSISQKFGITAEYYARINDYKNSDLHDAFALGFDYITGGHVFQIQVTNAQSMFESGFMRQTTGNFWKGDLHLGFNMTRNFSLGNKKKIKKETIETTQW